MWKTLSAGVRAVALGEGERGARPCVPSPRQVICQKVLAEVGLQRDTGATATFNRGGANSAIRCRQRTCVIDGFASRSRRRRQSGHARDDGSSRLVNARKVHLIGETESLHGLPDDAIVGGHHGSVVLRVAGIRKRASSPIQSLVAVVVIR